MLFKKLYNKKATFLKYSFYQNALKKQNKKYFLLDFFKGLKGSFFLANIKKKKNIYYIYKSFNKFKKYKNIDNFDYFFKSLNKFASYKLKELKKKNNIFLTFFVKHARFYSVRFNSIWFLNFFFNLKKNYMQNLNFELLKNLNYLSCYYNFIKNNLICKVFFILKECKLLKNKNHKINHLYIFFFNKFYIFFNSCNILNHIYLYNKYNNFKDYKILLINKILKKLNKYLSNFKALFKKNKKHNLKGFFVKLINSLKYNNLCLFNPFIFSLLNKKIKIKNNVNILFSNLKSKNKNKFKLHFYFNFFYRAFISQRLKLFSINKKIILQYYFYFYNFIIKIFIKLFYSFKFLIFNKNNIIIKKIIWFKIMMIFLYYKKIIINIKKEKSDKVNNKLIKNLKFKSLQFKNKVLNLKLKFYIKNLPEWKKKIVTGKIKNFSRDLQSRVNLISEIKVLKKGDYFYSFSLAKLTKIYISLLKKIKRMERFQKKGILSKSKLMKFIKNNKLKKRRVYKAIGLI